MREENIDREISGLNRRKMVRVQVLSNDKWAGIISPQSIDQDFGKTAFINSKLEHVSSSAMRTRLFELDGSVSLADRLIQRFMRKPLNQTK